jgi:hypothetical protein
MQCPLFSARPSSRCVPDLQEDFLESVLVRVLKEGERACSSSCMTIRRVATRDQNADPLVLSVFRIKQTR